MVSLDWTVIGTVIGGFSTLIYTIFTLMLLFENRALRKAGTEPKVIAHFEMHPSGNGVIQLSLSNVGKGPALDVSFSFEYESGEFENYDLLFDYGKERPAMTMIGQGEKFSFSFAIGNRLFSPKDDKVSKELRPFNVKINWKSLANKKQYSEKYLLDISAYKSLPGLIEKPSIVIIAEELQKINKNISQIISKQNTSHELVDLTKIEQRIRSNQIIPK